MSGGEAPSKPKPRSTWADPGRADCDPAPARARRLAVLRPPALTCAPTPTPYASCSPAWSRTSSESASPWRPDVALLHVDRAQRRTARRRSRSPTPPSVQLADDARWPACAASSANRCMSTPSTVSWRSPPRAPSGHQPGPASAASPRAAATSATYDATKPATTCGRGQRRVVVPGLVLVELGGMPEQHVVQPEVRAVADVAEQAEHRPAGRQQAGAQLGFVEPLDELRPSCDPEPRASRGPRAWCSCLGRRSHHAPRHPRRVRGRRGAR